MSDAATAPHSPPPTPLSWRLGLGAAILLLGGTAYLLEPWIGVRGRALFGALAFILLVAAFSANLRAVKLANAPVWNRAAVSLILFILQLGYRTPVTPEMTRRSS